MGIGENTPRDSHFHCKMIVIISLICCFYYFKKFGKGYVVVDESTFI